MEKFITKQELLHKRLILGYSQEYIAFKLGISQQAYSKIERGITNIKINDYIKIISVLGLNNVN